MGFRRTRLPLVALAMALLAGGAAYAATTTARPTANDIANVDLSGFSSPSAPAVFLEADLGGHAEPGRAGDPRGQATLVLAISGNQIRYEVSWQNMPMPSAMQIRRSGSMRMNLMPAGLPGSINAFAGVVNARSSGPESGMMISDPGRYSANFTTSAYPRGAVLGVFRRVGPVDFNRILHVGNLVAVGSGDQEVPAAGDGNAHTTVFVGAGATTLNYAAIWSGVTSPTELSVNRGAVGANGGLVARLFAAPHGLNPTVLAVAGTVTNVPAALVAALKADPALFHSNLRTGRFPGGAARGQFFVPMAPTTTPPPTTKPTTSTTSPMPTTTKPPTTSMSATVPPTTTATVGSHW